MNPQRNDSLHDQMMDVIREAERLGCYDAADWIKKRWNMPYQIPKATKPPVHDKKVRMWP